MRAVSACEMLSNPPRVQCQPAVYILQDGFPLKPSQSANQTQRRPDDEGETPLMPEAQNQELFLDIKQTVQIIHPSGSYASFLSFRVTGAGLSPSSLPLVRRGQKMISQSFSNHFQRSLIMIILFSRTQIQIQKFVSELWAGLIPLFTFSLRQLTTSHTLASDFRANQPSSLDPDANSDEENKVVHGCIYQKWMHWNGQQLRTSSNAFFLSAPDSPSGGRSVVVERSTSDRKVSGLIPALPTDVSKCPLGRH